MNTKQILTVIFSSVFMSIVAIGVITYLINIPVVYVSYKSGLCTKIEINGTDFACNQVQLGKYFKVWVQ